MRQSFIVPKTKKILTIPVLLEEGWTDAHGRLLLAMAEALTQKTAQGSHRAAVQYHSQEKVLCLEGTWGTGATESPAIARKKKEKKQSAKGS